ncbi:MAG: 2Fe-2S iron-sulfur cluster binding domain-containing protein, partial [Oscillospiraceae bacterium]|nr:2Fe-2S iron-sulfur cluster binding domain-containing protein [Oscillospiraceae bacterium]
MPIVDIPAESRKIEVAANTNLLDALKQNGIYPDAPCGGNGLCGKCKMIVNNDTVLACKTMVDRNMTVVLPRVENMQTLRESPCTES